jgi:hypothetical protein
MSAKLEIEEDWSLRVQIEDMSEGEGKQYRCFLYDPDTYNKEWGKGWNEPLGEGWGDSPRLAFIKATEKLEWKEGK